MKKEVKIGYGLLVDPIRKQLKDQGFKFSSEKVQEFEVQRNAINTLRFGCVDTPDSLHNKLLLRLHKKVVSHVKSKNK